jgi:hypothetical protein
VEGRLTVNCAAATGVVPLVRLTLTETDAPGRTDGVEVVSVRVWAESIAANPKKESISLIYHHSNVAPAFATMAELETSDANRTITVPFADGFITPSMMATLPEVIDVALAAEGVS